jgi:hypothetical protein
VRLVEWLWGEPLGKVIKVKSWWPSIDRRARGIAWPTMLIDRLGSRATTTPIWNLVWLRNRLVK